MLPTAMEVMEGGELELCVVIYIPPERLEREVNLIFNLIPISPYAGNKPYWIFILVPLNPETIFVGERDLVLAKESPIIIPPINGPVLAPPQYCLTIDAIDDQIVEGTESFNFIVRASNPLDMVIDNGSTTIDITDNDGK